jgi:hypothetical protein
MKHSLILFMLITVSTIQTYSANRTATPAVAPIKSFLIDPSRPYVYLRVDHIGPRNPDDNREPNIGIYLRLINNCRLAIIVNTFGAPAEAERDEIGVLDKVVLNPSGFGDGDMDGTGGESKQMPLILSVPDEILSPEMREVKAKARLEEQQKAKAEADQEKFRKEAETKELAERPTGYQFDVASFVTIPPGKAVYFSVPINHVNKRWHFEVPFRFDLARRGGPVRQPYSYVAFFEEDLPEARR